MAKKKVEEIKLSEQELVPATIGNLNDRNGTTAVLIFLFVCLIGFTVVLPYVSEIITEFNAGNTNTSTPSNNNNNNNNNDNNDDHPDVNEVVYYDLTTNFKIELEGLTISNFVLNAATNKITYTVKNTSASIDFFKNNLYYIEIFSEDNTLLQRIKVPTTNVSKTVETTLNGDLDPNVINIAKKLSFILKTENDYPNVTLTKESEESYKMICSKNEYEFTYYFDSEYNLNTIQEVYTVDMTDFQYNELLSTAQILSGRYNTLDGVTSTIVSTTVGFSMTSTIDLTKTDLTNDSNKAILNHEALYTYKTQAKVIYFELSSMLYNCK